VHLQVKQDIAHIESWIEQATSQQNPTEPAQESNAPFSPFDNSGVEPKVAENTIKIGDGY